VVECGLNVGQERDGVSDYAGLGGDVGGVFEAGEAEAAVVAG
jgi:hypothetical protein